VNEYITILVGLLAVSLREKIQFQIRRGMCLAAHTRNGHRFRVEIDIGGHTPLQIRLGNGRGYGSATISHHRLGMGFQDEGRLLASLDRLSLLRPVGQEIVAEGKMFFVWSKYLASSLRKSFVCGKEKFSLELGRSSIGCANNNHNPKSCELRLHTKYLCLKIVP